MKRAAGILALAVLVQIGTFVTIVFQREGVRRLRAVAGTDLPAVCDEVTTVQDLGALGTLTITQDSTGGRRPVPVFTGVNDANVDELDCKFEPDVR